jgi:hypothetical protein
MKNRDKKNRKIILNKNSRLYESGKTRNTNNIIDIIFFEMEILNLNPYNIIKGHMYFMGR